MCKNTLQVHMHTYILSHTSKHALLLHVHAIVHTHTCTHTHTYAIGLVFWLASLLTLFSLHFSLFPSLVSLSHIILGLFFSPPSLITFSSHGSRERERAPKKGITPENVIKMRVSLKNEQTLLSEVLQVLTLVT